MENYIDKLLETIELLGQPNWFDYLQVISSILSIIISAWAVIMAVKIPKKIAEKQDKISLFDKRFAAYDVFLRYEAFATGIVGIYDIKIYREGFMNMFFLDESSEFEGNKAIYKIVQISTPLQHMPFLFENITDSEMGVLFSSMMNFVVAISKNIDVEESKDRLVSNINTFKEKHIKSIIDTLKINSVKLK